MSELTKDEIEEARNKVVDLYEQLECAFSEITTMSEDAFIETIERIGGEMIALAKSIPGAEGIAKSIATEIQEYKTLAGRTLQ